MEQNIEPTRLAFGGEEFQRPADSFQAPTPRIVQWVIKYSGGYINDGRRAMHVLTGLVIAMVFVSLTLILSGGSPQVKTFPEDVLNQPY